MSLLILNVTMCYITHNQNDILSDWNVIDDDHDDHDHDQNEMYIMKLPIHITQNPSQSLIPSMPSSYWSYYFTEGTPKRNGHYSQRLGK
ncbi:unnamed protein product [Schistosoma margrebowiei]|uniref:Uncharacterized protein n=1 Tax=Schistosoma margrebowiei TaxID=48269 RepID=A0A183N8Q7_9TREM|nr:unnamed protein product [Schistosoma margrebowiei]